VSVADAVALADVDGVIWRMTCGFQMPPWADGTPSRFSARAIRPGVQPSQASRKMRFTTGTSSSTGSRIPPVDV
jgi:hypothetical protein